MSKQIPTQAKKWQYNSVQGGLENNLVLNTVDVPKPKPNQHLVRVTAVSLNPVDYKIAEAPVVGSLAASKPATPGVEVVGEIVTAATGSTLKTGTLVVGLPDGGLAAAGGLAEYVVMSQDKCVAVPEGVSTEDAVITPVASLTALQAMAPHIKAGDHVFFNGGSGGVGTQAIQIAKILGAHITVTCSARNVELVKSLGADEVVDYTADNVVDALSRLPYKIDHVVDGVGGNRELFWQAHRYTRPGAAFIGIAFAPTVKEISFILKAYMLPSFLGGGKRKMTIMASAYKQEDMEKVLGWMQEKKLKAVIDSHWPMEQAVEALKKMKTSRARGKIIVDVA